MSQCASSIVKMLARTIIFMATVGCCAGGTDFAMGFMEGPTFGGAPVGMIYVTNPGEVTATVSVDTPRIAAGSGALFSSLTVPPGGDASLSLDDTFQMSGSGIENIVCGSAASTTFTLGFIRSASRVGVDPIGRIYVTNPGAVTATVSITTPRRSPAAGGISNTFKVSPGDSAYYDVDYSNHLSISGFEDKGSKERNLRVEVRHGMNGNHINFHYQY